MEKLRQSIRAAMRKRGVSPGEFHREVGIGRSTLFSLLDESTSAEPSLRTVRKLRAAGVRIPRELLLSA